MIRLESGKIDWTVDERTDLTITAEGHGVVTPAAPPTPAAAPPQQPAVRSRPEGRPGGNPMPEHPHNEFPGRTIPDHVDTIG